MGLHKISRLYTVDDVTMSIFYIQSLFRPTIAFALGIVTDFYN